MTLVLCVVLVALMFEYINGFHDTANAIATSVATKVLTPAQAIILATVFNLVGALVGEAVAKTIGSGLVDTRIVTMTSLVCALAGAIAWNLITWWYGLPSSSSHALIGGLCGAALAASSNSWASIVWYKPEGDFLHSQGLLPKVVLPMVAAPVIGLVIGFLLMCLLYVSFSRVKPFTVNRVFGKVQLLSAAWMSLSHGTNDAQKTMGIIALTLTTGTIAGTFDKLPGFLSFLYNPAESPSVYAAHNMLGKMYRDGLGVAVNPNHAAAHFEKAAKKKNPEAQYNLAQLYLQAVAVKPNIPEAVKLLQSAADSGFYPAQTNLAFLYQRGVGLAKDDAKAEKWLQIAATNQPGPVSIPALVACKIKNQPTNLVAAVKWLQEKVAGNNADAQVNLAVMYFHGTGGEHNEAEALRLLKLAADRQQPDALYNVGSLHFYGRGFPQDYAAAMKCFKHAAATGGIKFWIKFACAIVMAAGTAAGGWRIIRTMGTGVVKMQPVHGFAAQTTAAGVIIGASTLGIPLSTTHVISSSIMGVGASKRFNAVKWSVAERMVWAWFMTIPITAIMSYGFLYMAQLCGIK